MAEVRTDSRLRIFDEVLVEPLEGDWAKGWALRLKACPWAVLLPKGDQVVATVGCGAVLKQLTSDPGPPSRVALAPR